MRCTCLTTVVLLLQSQYVKEVTEKKKRGSIRSTQGFFMTSSTAGLLKGFPKMNCVPMKTMCSTYLAMVFTIHAKESCELFSTVGSDSKVHTISYCRPNLTSSLVGVLLRFREEPIAFMSDVKSMFCHVRVAEADKDFLRFLWWPNGDMTAEYRMTVHLFGAVSSPSCAGYPLTKTAHDHQ